jgi:hypothetical protein
LDLDTILASQPVTAKRRIAIEDIVVSVIMIPIRHLMVVKEILQQFDEYLLKRGLRFEAVVIGGAALNLLGVISRPTNDCDVLCPEISAEIADASHAFAADIRERGGLLQKDWLNNGPVSLSYHLLGDWEQRIQPLFSGRSIQLRCLHRSDFLCAKLFALCDRGIDLGDCIALAPTKSDLATVLPWLERPDANPDWPTHVRATFTDLARRLGHVL